MNKETKLKPYHIILFSCIFGVLPVVHSNHANQKRALDKQNQAQEQLFHRLIYKIKLDEEDDFQNIYSEEVCSRASSKLKKYYQTGDPSKIGISTGNIECKDKNKGYMDILIDLVRHALKDDNVKRSGDSVLKLAIKYLLTRLLIFGIFLAIGILGIIGWPACWISYCYNCCWCCCFKKTKFKIPCFIFAYIFYALTICFSIYGLTQSNKIFVGLANTECSLLKFFEQVLYGEMKQDLPRWGGIPGIINLLGDLNSTIADLSTNSYAQLNTLMNNITEKKTDFENYLKEVGDEFYDGTNYKAPYVKTYTGEFSGTYVYDVVYNFGRYSNNEYTPNSLLYQWYDEYSLISDNAYENLKDAQKDFQDLLDENMGDVYDALGDGMETLEELSEPFNDANEEIGEFIFDISESIDRYGKLTVKIIFGVLMAMNIALTALMILIFLFSGRSLNSYQWVKCLFKYATHILWNILALFMILALVAGSLIAIIGRAGDDSMSLVSFVLSKENFNDNNTPLVLNKLGKAKQYIYRCIHGDGDISKELKLGDSLKSFDNIISIENSIDNALKDFTAIFNNLPTYNIIKEQLEDKFHYKEETMMMKIDSNGFHLSYSEILSKLNEQVTDGNKWSTENENTYSCGDPLPPGSYYYPRSCKYKQSPSYYSSSEFAKYANILTDMDDIVSYANENEEPESGKAKRVRKVVEEIKNLYKEHLDEYIKVLRFYFGVIIRITELVRKYIGEGGEKNAFGFLNGKFIGTNVRILLKYLQQSLGNDFYMVGISLIIVGFSLIFSISSTILLIIIINIELEEIKVRERKQGSATGLIGISESRQNIPPKIPRKY